MRRPAATASRSRGSARRRHELVVANVVRLTRASVVSRVSTPSAPSACRHAFNAACKSSAQQVAGGRPAVTLSLKNCMRHLSDRPIGGDTFYDTTCSGVASTASCVGASRPEFRAGRADPEQWATRYARRRRSTTAPTSAIAGATQDRETRTRELEWVLIFAAIAVQSLRDGPHDPDQNVRQHIEIRAHEELLSRALPKILVVRGDHCANRPKAFRHGVHDQSPRLAAGSSLRNRVSETTLRAMQSVTGRT